MEEHLEVSKTLFKKDTKIIYVASNTPLYTIEPGSVVLQPDKLQDCPDVDTLFKAIAKKVSRVSVMKLQKYSSSLCIALLASKGYCITSLELKDIPDTVVEVCWESLHNIYISVHEPLKSWLSKIISGRSYVDYGKQFCQNKFLSSTINTVGSKLLTDTSFKIVSRETSSVNDVIWHRDDSIYSALSSHFRHQM